MTLTNKDLEILIEMEHLSHTLIEKYVTKEYDEEGNVINKESDLWTNYWNLIERLIQKRDKRNKINTARINEKRKSNKFYGRSKKEIERMIRNNDNKCNGSL